MSFDALLGQKIKGYQLDEVLGQGGMGVVYRAHHPLIGKRVAIKVLLGHQNLNAVSRFILEARAVNDIRHENLIDILDFDELPAGNPYIIMEYLEGRALDDALEDAPFSIDQVGHIGLQLCSALFAAHQKGIIHRDLKGENVFLITRASQKNFVKVLDFGIAKLLDTKGHHRTEHNALLGTPLYMAPEQITGEKVDARTDIYALGVLLYQMVTGKPPFYDPSPMVLLAMQVTAVPTPPSQVVQNVPPKLEEAILRCLQKKPSDRFSSMEELAIALGDACGLDVAVYLGNKLMSQRLFTAESGVVSNRPRPKDLMVDAPTETAQVNEVLDLTATVPVLPSFDTDKLRAQMVADAEAKILSEAASTVESEELLPPQTYQAPFFTSDIYPTSEMTQEDVRQLTDGLPDLSKEHQPQSKSLMWLWTMLSLVVFGAGFSLWWFVLRPN